ncbi:MAG: hypothetical protein MR355_08930 [Lachnospiraceae bacterium]|nr:hypothetical protein [Lachnospiraceae bacterium]
MDTLIMFQPMKLLLLSYNLTCYNWDRTLLLIQLYPFLVVIPAGFSLMKERQSGQEVYLIARMGRKKYLWSKMLAVFGATAFIFTVPFFLEIVLNCLSFPLGAGGDLSNLHYFSEEYAQIVDNYLMTGLFLKSPYLYAVIGVLIFGCVSGLLGVFTMAISSVWKVKYSVFLFLPVVILLNVTIILNNRLAGNSVFIRWYDYLLLFNEESKNGFCLLIVVMILLIFSIGLVFGSTRKDYI